MDSRLKKQLNEQITAQREPSLTVHNVTLGQLTPSSPVNRAGQEAQQPAGPVRG